MAASGRSMRVETSHAQVSPDGERVHLVDELDLEPIVYKLMHPEPGVRGMSLEQADRAVGLYRGFLKLSALVPGVTLVPTRLLDQVWHTHVLDTAKYRADCDKVFGRFVDHYPYAGLRGELDRRSWRSDFARTRQLFYEYFAVDIGAKPAASACSNHGDGSDCCVGCISGDRPRPRR
jgi:hypothetical protein